MACSALSRGSPKRKIESRTAWFHNVTFPRIRARGDMYLDLSDSSFLRFLPTCRINYLPHPRLQDLHCRMKQLGAVCLWPDSIVFPPQIDVGTGDVAVHHMLLSRSFRTKTRNCLKSPEVQSARSASSIAIRVTIRQESSVLSVKRTWMYSEPSSNL